MRKPLECRIFTHGSSTRCPAPRRTSTGSPPSLRTVTGPHSADRMASSLAASSVPLTSTLPGKSGLAMNAKAPPGVISFTDSVPPGWIRLITTSMRMGAGSLALGSGCPSNRPCCATSQASTFPPSSSLGAMSSAWSQRAGSSRLASGMSQASWLMRVSVSDAVCSSWLAPRPAYVASIQAPPPAPTTKSSPSAWPSLLRTLPAKPSVATCRPACGCMPKPGVSFLAMGGTPSSRMKGLTSPTGCLVPAPWMSVVPIARFKGPVAVQGTTLVTVRRAIIAVPFRVSSCFARCAACGLRGGLPFRSVRIAMPYRRPGLIAAAGLKVRPEVIEP
mmetsp:Transcript_32789/g.83774  ORF Transcript_32789/g.83774 Transcript_32789/m.83774 type:complete len:332 (-) Transcript_32789:113-1108(-)